MRRLALAALAVLIPTPAIAQVPPANADTYKAMIEHGIVLVLPDLEVDVKFAADGTFTALGGMGTGTWKIAGDELCTVDGQTKVETCQAYPAGKKSGDTFDLDTPQGAVPVRIL
jgi:hypothetical protein